MSDLSESDMNDLDHKRMDDKKPNMNAKDIDTAVKDDIVWDKLQSIVSYDAKHEFKQSTNFTMTLTKKDRFINLILSRHH